MEGMLTTATDASSNTWVRLFTSTRGEQSAKLLPNQYCMDIMLSQPWWHCIQNGTIPGIQVGISPGRPHQTTSSEVSIGSPNCQWAFCRSRRRQGSPDCCNCLQLLLQRQDQGGGQADLCAANLAALSKADSVLEHSWRTSPNSSPQLSV